MKKYLIYTTNSTEPFVIETEEDLIDGFQYALIAGELFMFIQHKKELIGTGTHRIDMTLNVSQIVSITTSEKV